MRTNTLPTQHRQLERAAGIEPASSAWKAEVLPLNYARLPTLPAELLAPIIHALGCASGGGRRIRTFEAFAADLQSAPFGHSGTPPEWRPILPPIRALSSACFCNNLTLKPLTVHKEALTSERAILCQSSWEKARPARIFSSPTGTGTLGAPDIRPARSAAVSGKHASRPPYTISGHTAWGA